MTDELIEQVARAICASNGCEPDTRFEGSPIWVDWAVDARAALAAINLPARLEAARKQGWNEAIEAAADVVCGLVAKHAQDAVVADVADKLGQAIRALTKENSDA